MKTIEECYKICENNDKFEFVKKGGFVTFIYTKDGVTPEDFYENDALELRGLTFSHGDSYPMIHKFFNYGETDKSLTYTDDDVESIQIKDDGSTISFVKDAYGKIFPKTKSSFSNEIVDIANKWLAIDTNGYAVKDLLNDGYHPIFEAVSPSFNMVLEYDVEELVLIQIRRDEDWSYLKKDEFIELANQYNFTYRDFVSKTFSEILSEKSTAEGIEGYVVRFKNGDFIKVKMDWYFSRHGDSEGMKVLNELIPCIHGGPGREMSETLPSIIKFYKSIEDLMALPEYEAEFNFGKLRFDNSFTFREKIKSLDENFKTKYTQIYRTFLSEYSTETNIFSPNGLLRIILDNRLDDYLPSVIKQKAIEFRNIEILVFDFIKEEELKIFKLIDDNTHPSDAPDGYFNALIKMILGKKVEKKYIRELLKKTLIKNLNKRVVADKFIKSLLKEKGKT